MGFSICLVMGAFYADGERLALQRSGRHDNRMSRFTVRVAEPDDAVAAATLLGRAFAGREFLLPDGSIDAAGFLRLIQTGSEVLVAERGGRLRGVVRRWHDDGIAWFDLLASDEPGAARALVTAVEKWAQDRGLRLVRMRLPDEGALPDLFARWGYVGYSREVVDANGRQVPMLGMEKRLPLLTVREQRRADAKALGEITGRDPWFFEQEARPGWFVASDGERVVGAIRVRDVGAGNAEIAEPVLADEYRGRNLELWMIDRAAQYAETRGFHTGRLPASDAMNRLGRDLEDRYWHREGDVYVRRFQDIGRRPDKDEP
jgi:GNAT superfamily N-acetyltransferase